MACRGSHRSGVRFGFFENAGGLFLDEVRLPACSFLPKQTLQHDEIEFWSDQLTLLFPWRAATRVAMR